MRINAYLHDRELINSKDITMPCFFIDNSLNDGEWFEDSSKEE